MNELRDKPANRQKNYENIISLGYFCGIAQDLEKLGLRSCSFPFDWVISSFPYVIEAIEKEFEDYLLLDNLTQDNVCRGYYHDENIMLRFIMILMRTRL